MEQQLTVSPLVFILLKVRWIKKGENKIHLFFMLFFVKKEKSFALISSLRVI